MKEELSSEDEIENAPDLSVTSDATTLLVMPNSDQSLVSSNPSIDNRTANLETKWAFMGFGSEERGNKPHTMYTQNNRVYPGRADKCQDSPLGAFHLLLDSHIISLIQNHTNVESRKVLCNED